MKNSLKVIIVILLIVALAGCGTNTSNEINKSTVIEPGAPTQWLYYNDEKFVFNRVIPKNEIDMSMVELTGYKTKMGDGAEDNQDIFLYKKDNSLFIISISINNGTEEQWVNFTKNED